MLFPIFLLYFNTTLLNGTLPVINAVLPHISYKCTNTLQIKTIFFKIIHMSEMAYCMHVQIVESFFYKHMYYEGTCNTPIFKFNDSVLVHVAFKLHTYNVNLFFFFSFALHRCVWRLDKRQEIGRNALFQCQTERTTVLPCLQ